MRDDGLEINSNHLPLPLCVYPWLKYAAVDAKIQRETAVEIFRQFSTILGAALEANAHPHRIIRILINAEALVKVYTEARFDELLPFQAALRRHIDRAFRVLRRHLIRCSLLEPQEQEFWRDILSPIDTHDLEAKEDWDAACAAVYQGRDLLMQLRGRDDEEIARERRLQREQLAKAGLTASDFHNE